MIMQQIILNESAYYLCTDLFEHHKSDFIGCKGRDVIKKKKLKPENYIYASQTKGVWKLSDDTYLRAKILITCEWYNCTFGSINDTSNKSQVI